MIKFFRKIRLKSMKQNKLGKYLLYATGEIILVVIGILIALQINNANLKKIEKSALEGYLQSISRNIESDLKNASNIYSKRKELLSKTSYINGNITARVLNSFSLTTNIKKGDYSKDDIVFTSETLKDIWDLNYINANTSGFESLKNSGYLSKLQGKEIGYLLSEYYNLINKISLDETNYNDRVQNARLEYAKSKLEGNMIFFQSDFVDWSGKTETFRPLMAEVLSDTGIGISLYLSYDLLVDYSNLISLGEQLMNLIAEGSNDDDQSRTILFDKFDGTGHPKLFMDGFLTSYYSYLEAYAYPIPSNSGSSLAYKELNMEFPAMPWSVLYFYVGEGSIEGLETKDYSSYSTLRVELKGAKGGEKIQISIKDETNPTDGSEAKVPLTLSNTWQVYDIPLSKFEGTNLKKLFMPAAFIVENEATTISIKNIEYLR